VAAQVTVSKDTKLSRRDLLITWGNERPSSFKTIVWGARILHDKNYHFAFANDVDANDDEKN
jgi:hypothetical protein